MTLIGVRDARRGADQRAELFNVLPVADPEQRSPHRRGVTGGENPAPIGGILGGRTPLQAVKEPDGREIVESLLIGFERGADETFPGAIRPDISVLRRLLNLPQKKL